MLWWCWLFRIWDEDVELVQVVDGEFDEIRDEVELFDDVFWLLHVMHFVDEHDLVSAGMNFPFYGSFKSLDYWISIYLA